MPKFYVPFLGIPIAWYEARISGFPRKSLREGASSLLGRGPERPKNVSCSRATQTCTGATLGGCPRARDIFGSLRPLPEKTTCSSPYRYSGKSRNSGLVPGNRNPKPFLLPIKLELVFLSRVRAKGVVLSERGCFCLLSTF